MLKNIAVRRKKLNLTQAKLAKLANVSQSMVAKIEAGRLDPSYTKARQILDKLDDLEHKEDVKAVDVLTPHVEVIGANDAVALAAEKMRKLGISQLPVIDNDKVIGSLSEKAILEQITKGASPIDMAAQLVRNVMESTPPLIPKSMPMHAVSELLKYTPLIIVVDKGIRLGVITKSDLLKFIKPA